MQRRQGTLVRAMLGAAALVTVVGGVAPLPVRAATPSPTPTASPSPTPTASPSPGGSHASFTLGPAHTDPNNPATARYFILNLRPGQSYTDAVNVFSGNQGDVDLFVSSVDGLTSATTGAVYGNRVPPPAKAGTWVRSSAATLHLANEAKLAVPFTVTVPADATPGDHLAGMAFENQATSSSGAGSVGITTVTREVIGVLIHVPGAAAFNLAIHGVEIGPLTPEEPYSAVYITMGDSGLDLGKPTLEVTLDGPNGYHRTVTKPLDTMLPGDVIRYPLVWPDALAAGQYTVTIVATASGMSPVTFSQTATLANALKPVPTSGPVPIVVQGAASSGVPLPVLVGVAGLGLLLGVMVSLVLSRRRRGGD